MASQNANSNDITQVLASLAPRQAGRPKSDIPGPQRAAMLMLALGEQYGGKVWSLLDDDEVRELSLQMSTLGTVEANRVEDMLLEFVSRMSASTVPSVDMWIDSSRTSSSSSSDQTLPPYCSPSASIRIAARFGPGSASPFGRLPWRCASEEITLVMSLALLFA